MPGPNSKHLSPLALRAAQLDAQKEAQARAKKRGAIGHNGALMSQGDKDQATPLTLQQRAELEGLTIRKLSNNSPIPEINSEKSKPKHQSAPRRNKKPKDPVAAETATHNADTQEAPSALDQVVEKAARAEDATATEQTEGAADTADDNGKAPRKRAHYNGLHARRLREIAASHQITQANQELTMVKAGPRRQSTIETDSAKEISETNLGYIDGFVSSLPSSQQQDLRTNILNAGYAVKAAPSSNPKTKEPEFDPPHIFDPEFLTLTETLSALKPLLPPQAAKPDTESEQEPKEDKAPSRSFIDEPLSPEIEIMVLDERLKNGDFPLPRYETSLAAGIDLRAMILEDIVLKPNASTMISTGIAIYMGRSGLCATILPRSGLGSNHGIVLGNLVGLIDADYQGELMVPIWNRSKREFTIKVGMRIAQMVFLPIIRPTFKQVEAFTPTERGTKGFGSTHTD